MNSEDSLYITRHTLIGVKTLFISCKFPGVVVNEFPPRTSNPPGISIDFVNCEIKKSDFSILYMEKTSVFRVQNSDGSCYQIDINGIKEIAPFFK